MNDNNNDVVKVPKAPWDYDENLSQVMDLIQSFMEHGYDSRSRLFDLIAVHGSEWKSQDLPEYWSIRALAVLTYLDGLESKSPDLVLPEGLRFNNNQFNYPYDYCKLVFHIAHKWRTITPSHELWRLIHNLAYHLSEVRQQIWNNPTNVVDLQRICDIYASFFTSQYVFDTLLDATREPAFKSSEEVSMWMQGQINTTKKSKAANAEIQRLYMQTSLFPGEDDSHARFECGVFASGYRDILESQRPNVSADAIWDQLHDFDVDGACGILKFYIINIMIRKNCHYSWVLHNLFVDINITTDIIKKLGGRRQPWIVLIGNTYYIREPQKLTTYVTQSSEDAIFTWFKLFWEQGEKEFFDGLDLFDMTRLPLRCPLNRQFFN